MKTIRVNILQEPELYQSLMYAFHSLTDYEGWRVSMYQETTGDMGQRIGIFTLREKEEGDP